MQTKLLKIVKWRLGITTDIRDEFIKFLIDSTSKEMKNQQKLEFTEDESELTEFVVDYVSFKYNNTEYKGMPRFLQLKLHNLKINRMRK